jgi:hypothetical protein
LEQKFYFRKQLNSCVKPIGYKEPATVDDEYEEMSMREIMCGKAPYFPGLIALVKTYLDMIKCDEKTRHVVDGYLTLIQQRATGGLMTAAAWFRQYATMHPAYKHDSVLPNEVVYDLVETCSQISQGKIEVPQLLGDLCNVCHKAPTALDERERGPYLAGARVLLNLPSKRGCTKFREFLFKNLHSTSAQTEFLDPCTGKPITQFLSANALSKGTSLNANNNNNNTDSSSGKHSHVHNSGPLTTLSVTTPVLSDRADTQKTDASTENESDCGGCS